MYGEARHGEARHGEYEEARYGEVRVWWLWGEGRFVPGLWAQGYLRLHEVLQVAPSKWRLHGY